MTDLNRFGNKPIVMAFYFLCVSNLIVALGMVAGSALLKKSPGPWGHTFDYHGEVYAHWDGQWYKLIARDGYSYGPFQCSSVAFFPAYPLLGGLASKTTGLPPEISLFIISNLALAGTFVIFAKYLQLRFPEPGSLVRDYSLLCLGIAPPTFFFRMAYSESLFLLVVVAIFYAVKREYPLILIAALIGLATAIRPVGIGLLVPFVVHTWQRTRRGWSFVGTILGLLPLLVWGISAYCAYLYIEFGDPLLFIKTQVHWRDRGSPPWPGKLIELATLEPIRSVFDPSSPGYWQRGEPGQSPLLSLHVADSAVFLAVVALVVIGKLKRWLTTFEVITAAVFLIIPYWTVGYGSYMKSMARYSSSVIPAYIVLGNIASRLNAAAIAAAAAASGLFLGIYTAMFVAYYFMI